MSDNREQSEQVVEPEAEGPGNVEEHVKDLEPEQHESEQVSGGMIVPPR